MTWGHLRGNMGHDSFSDRGQYHFLESTCDMGQGRRKEFFKGGLGTPRQGPQVLLPVRAPLYSQTPRAAPTAAPPGEQLAHQSPTSGDRLFPVGSTPRAISGRQPCDQRPGPPYQEATGGRFEYNSVPAAFTSIL